MTTLGLRISVLSRKVSSWQWCPLREVPLHNNRDSWDNGMALIVQMLL
jgi:hypothetical protein